MAYSKKRVWLIIALIVFISAIICFVLLWTDEPSRDPVKLTEYVDKHGVELIELAQQYPNQNNSMNNYLGLTAVDTRSDDVCYIFSWSFDLPEGGSFLYYAKDGILEIQNYTFADSNHINGLGINGQGYLNCIKLKQNWFFVESNIPT